MLNATQAMSDGAKPHAAGDRGELMLRIEPDRDEVRIHVTDTGPGIPADKVEDIFRPYVSMRSGGTGLGLPTARRIVQEHGGELTVHSEPGRGSDFVIHLKT
jgi:signal transduction histidine kinase